MSPDKGGRIRIPSDMKPGAALLVILSFWMATVGAARAQAPWPGEPWKSSTNLTALASADWQTNLSGAFWNPVKRQLWVVNNSGMFHKLVEGGPLGFMIDTTGGKPAKWKCGGDAEGITQAGLDENSVFVMNEDGYMEEYATTRNGVVDKLHTWDIRSVAAPVDGSGPEGIAFVPDEWLRAQGFSDKDGKQYTSVKGMSGLFFVAHQDGGYVHVFDCSRADNSWAHVGTYSTAREESSDLAFDRSVGALYIWHNIGSNSFEAAHLASRDVGGGKRALQVLKEFTGPKSGNLEGFAMTPASAGEHWSFATDDDNQDGYALMWFKAFKPGIFKADFKMSRVAACIGDAIQFADSSIGLNGTERHAWNFGDHAITGTGAAPATGPGPHTVRYTGAGRKTIVSSIAGSIADSVSKTMVISDCATGIRRNPDRAIRFSHEFIDGMVVWRKGYKGRRVDGAEMGLLEQLDPEGF